MAQREHETKPAQHGSMQKTLGITSRDEGRDNVARTLVAQSAVGLEVGPEVVGELVGTVVGEKLPPTAVGTVVLGVADGMEPVGAAVGCPDVGMAVGCGVEQKPPP